MGIFAEASETETYDKSSYFAPGLYLVELVKFKENNGAKGLSYVAECTVLGANSNSPDAPDPGTTAAWVLTGFSVSEMRRKMALGDLKKFLGVLISDLTGTDPETMTPDQWDAFGKMAVDHDGAALKGTILRLECFATVTKNGKPFTVHHWHRAGHPKMQSAITAQDYADFGLTTPA